MAIPNNIFGVMISPEDNPKKISASTNASSRLIGSLSVAYLCCKTDNDELSFVKTPLLLNISIFSSFTPSKIYILAQARAAEPAPETTIFKSSAFFPANSNAFNNAADDIMAVPCWSSCITGIFNSSTNLRSISKDSGAFMSSRLIPPKVGAMFFTVWINSSMFLVPISMSNTSIPAKILNNNPFPSITGFDASGPMSPSPKTAVPFDITATRFPFAVYL